MKNCVSCGITVEKAEANYLGYAFGNWYCKVCISKFSLKFPKRQDWKQAIADVQRTISFS